PSRRPRQLLIRRRQQEHVLDDLVQAHRQDERQDQAQTLAIALAVNRGAHSSTARQRVTGQSTISRPPIKRQFRTKSSTGSPASADPAWPRMWSRASLTR